MAENEYPYPPDQFDREAEQASYHGAHRAAEPFWRQNLLYIIIIAASVLTLLILLFVIGGMNRDTDSAEAPSPTAAATTSASASASLTASEAEGDRATPVLVVNASGENGLAGTWRSALKEKGWTNVGVDTSSTRQEKALVFYKDEKDAASAKLLAQDVGADGAQQSDDYDARITYLAVSKPES